MLRESLSDSSYEILDDVQRTSPDLEPRPVEGYFVLADNRDHASDSRQSGAVSRDRIRGVVWKVLSKGDLP